MTRRDLLRMIGMTAGSAAMYQAMTSLGFAAESNFSGMPSLGAAPKGTSVLILGAGLAGMVAAFELRKAGYSVQVLEYNDRAGGRNWTLRGGDRYTELGGETQHCEFDPGLYINPGPWRLPYHHRGILGYCKQFGIPLEPFIQTNYNAFQHSSKAFGGKPQRYRAVRADYHGHIGELLAKVTNDGGLDAEVSKEDQQKLLASLQWWGALDKNYKYTKGIESCDRRGFNRDPGGGLSARPELSTPTSLADLLDSELWGALPIGDIYELQQSLLQPVGGMGRIGEAFARELGPLIRYRAKVVDIDQDDSGVRVSFEDSGTPGSRHQASADWCVCTIPLSILGEMPIKVGQPMAAAIAAVPYASSVKIGLQFKRRFWEQDDQIFGGISYTDLPIGNISYPSDGFQGSGKAVLLGGYMYGPDAMRFTAMTPAQRIREAVIQGSQIHPQYPAEFDNGISVAWHRSPFTLGCFGMWTEAMREQHYDNLCAFDGRIVLAGEHASYLPAWQEGAVTSAHDAIDRLHRRAIAHGAKT
ncbi:MAG TPA: flavin monoamine oxidase family protein [Dokdonella sp.]|uniref:flavin monoamine oxidase family protein n=1 Tax=Dokdonella sp. TaxID=2291710 RepID=UPI002D7EA771|nr:flavin monoamine oxidase family protein [Dokdonella sp.]HET9031899.1 flavin monoamine oxidase family protein [Dokdonella sp.]